MGLIETAGKILEGIEAKAARGFEITGNRPKYLLVGAADYPVVLGAVRLTTEDMGAFARDDDLEDIEVCGLKLIQVNTLRLLEVGW